VIKTVIFNGSAAVLREMMYCFFDTERKNLMLHTFLSNLAQPTFNNT